MFRPFILSSFEASFGCWLSINHPFFHCFLFSLWFGCVANWLLEKLQLDTEYQIQGSPHVVNGLYNTWGKSWNNLPTYNNWEHFETNRISAVICLALGITTHLLGFAKSFFRQFVLFLPHLDAGILEGALTQLPQQEVSCQWPVCWTFGVHLQNIQQSMRLLFQWIASC